MVPWSQKRGEADSSYSTTKLPSFRELGLHDFGLFDFRVDVEGNPFLLECNLFCSFGPQSVVNIVAKDSGFTDESLFDMMVENLLLRKRQQENNNFNLW